MLLNWMHASYTGENSEMNPAEVWKHSDLSLVFCSLKDKRSVTSSFCEGGGQNDRRSCCLDRGLTLLPTPLHELDNRIT